MSLFKSLFIQHDKPFTRSSSGTKENCNLKTYFRCETMGYGKLEKTYLQ
jgi:hypothetical protein